MVSKYRRKGNMVVDSLVSLVILFVFVLVIYFGSSISDDVNADIQLDDDFTNNSKQISQDLNTKYSTTFDSAVMMVLILFWMLTLAFSFLIDSSPIFFIISLVLLVAVLIVAAYLGNTYEEIAADEELGNITNKFPMTHFVFSHIVGFIISIALSIGVALYAKTRI